MPAVPVFATNLVGPGKIGLIIFHVGSLPTAQLVFLCGSPLPDILPPQLEAENTSVDQHIYHQGFEWEFLRTLRKLLFPGCL